MNTKTKTELRIEANAFGMTFMLTSMGLMLAFDLAGTSGVVALPLAFAAAAVFASRAANKAVESWRAEQAALAQAASKRLLERA